MAGIVAAALPAGGALGQSVRLLGDFSNWSAYSAAQGSGELCFVLSKPTEIEPVPDGYSDSYLYLTHRTADGIRNELNVIAGFTFAEDSEATVSIGDSSYPLFTDADAAWLADVAQAQSVAGSMRAGSTMTIEGTTERGIKVVQTYSLSGVTAASRAIDSECG